MVTLLESGLYETTSAEVEKTLWCGRHLRYNRLKTRIIAFFYCVGRRMHPECCALLIRKRVNHSVFTVYTFHYRYKTPFDPLRLSSRLGLALSYGTSNS